MTRLHRLSLMIVLLGVGLHSGLAPAQPPNHVAGKLVELNDNGAWSWFMDDRAVVLGDTLVVGSVRAVGSFATGEADPDGGNVEISTYHLGNGMTGRTILHRHFEQDDHDAPALLVLPDRRILALYSKHGQDRKILYRLSEPGDPLRWGEAKVFESPGKSPAPFKADNVTYNNPFRLTSGRILNFYRGVHLDPNWMFSDDDGKTWRYGGHLFLGKGGYSPYMRYAFDGKDTVHFVATEDHPRNYDNSVYHGFLRDGVVHFSDGKALGPASTTTVATVATWDLTRVFAGDPDHVAWVDDLKLGRDGNPRVLFSVKRDGRGTHGKGGMDIRFHHGRWDGRAWRTREIAHAGSRLYAGENDYTGLAAFDRNDLDVVYISTDADPATGQALVSKVDGRRHRELFRGKTKDPGDTWHWEPITTNSTVDNIRPIVPAWDDSRTVLVWMRGGYRSNRGEWTTAVVATVLPGR
ncbi:MAG: BNR-4 repeat-containing protein [Isosphaeraceae bacterium]